METILFLIIVGILSSLFNKAKGKGNPAQTKPFTAKGFNDRRAIFEQHRKNSQKSISTGEPAAEINTANNHEEKYGQFKKSQDLNNGGRMHSTAQSKVKVEEESFVPSVPDRNTIINGIIWSEILNEPRAKRPYYSKKG